ncbi:MAG: efflux RND transporter permease subunit [Lachnospiraceae bacterium]|nr:efflux RND transporter permease subunit [Lachnospiraceae bacterium]
MSKFSVKKPFTVFVAVVAILVLGIVSYTKMTPDLMPNMNLPYVMVMTTYPGATPEKVETEVTRPLEQSFATLDKIKSINSTSSENYSMITLEFSEDVNMDTISVDILQNVDMISGNWDEMVGTPYILKINPSLLPVSVTAVGMEGMETAELSDFMEEEIIPKLEGIEGVASVDASGMVDTQIHVVLNQEKIDAVNAEIVASLDEKFEEAETELADGEYELNKGKADIASGKQELEEGKEALSSEMATAQAQINSGNSELMIMKTQLQMQLQELQLKKTELETSKTTLTELQTTITGVEEQKAQLETAVAGLQQAKEAVIALDTASAGFDAAIAAIQNDDGTNYPTQEIKDAAIAAITSSQEYLEVQAGYATIDAQLAAMGASRDTLDATIATYQGYLDQANAGLAQIDAELAKQGLTRADVPKSLAEIEAGLTQINAGIEQLENGLAQIEAGDVQLSEAQKTLDEQKTLMIFQLSDATTQLLIGESQINSAKTALEDGKTQLEDAKEDAYEQADLNNIITMDMVSNILMAQNFAMPAGYVKQDGIQYMVNVGDTITTDEEIADLLLFDMGMEGVDPIYLSDVADVFIYDNSGEVYANIDGTNGIMLSFTKQSTYATATVSDSISEKLEELEKEYEGFHYSIMMDQGDYIYLIIDSIMSSLLWGALFAIIVLFLFLKDIKPTFITLCSIPVSVTFAIVLMYFSGVTINMISLSGLAIAVGMLVDNSVVVIENTYRLINKGESVLKAAVAGASQVAGAVTSSTLTTICVFVPIVFVEGLTRQIFMDLALTIAYSLLASLAIALTLVPAMSAGLLKNTKLKEHKLMNKVIDGYERVVNVALNHRWITLAIALFMLVFSVALLMAKGFIFMPEMSTNQLSATITMPEDATFEELREASDGIVTDVQKMDGVVSVGAMAESGTSATALMSGGSGLTTTLYVMLTEEEKVDTNQLAKDISALGEKYSCTVEASGDSMSAMMAMLGGTGVTVRIYGDDLETLQETAIQVADVVSDVDGTANVSDGMDDATPAVKVTVNKEKAMKEGLTVAQIYQELSGSITTEKTATNITMEGAGYDVVVKKGDGLESTLSDIRNYTFTLTDKEGEEKTVYLRNIADITETESLQSINRSEQRRYLDITAELEDGYNVTLVTEDVQKALSEYELPAGVTMEFMGQNETIMESMEDLLLMMLVGIILVYLIMVAQFQSLKSPFIVLFTIPLAFTGGFLGLLLTGMELSVISMMGFVMLCGIIVNNGIVLVEFVNQLREEGMEKREALVEAGKTRMRPILMTTITTILGLVVMAMAKGQGSEMMQPIAIVCIGGLTYATLMTLFVIPVLYDMFNKKEMNVIRDEDLILESE